MAPRILESSAGILQTQGADEAEPVCLSQGKEPVCLSCALAVPWLCLSCRSSQGTLCAKAPRLASAKDPESDRTSRAETQGAKQSAKNKAHKKVHKKVHKSSARVKCASQESGHIQILTALFEMLSLESFQESARRLLRSHGQIAYRHHLALFIPQEFGSKRLI